MSSWANKQYPKRFTFYPYMKSLLMNVVVKFKYVKVLKIVMP